MSELASKTLGRAADVIAPDGCEVRILAQTRRGSMAHFALGPGQVSRAVAHRTVEEVWYFLSGQGRMWRLSEFLKPPRTQEQRAVVV